MNILGLIFYRTLFLKLKYNTASGVQVGDIEKSKFCFK